MSPLALVPPMSMQILVATSHQRMPTQPEHWLLPNSFRTVLSLSLMLTDLRSGHLLSQVCVMDLILIPNTAKLRSRLLAAELRRCPPWSRMQRHCHRRVVGKHN